MKKIFDILVGININLVNFFLGIFDRYYQKKIIKKFKYLFGNKINTVFDVGAHRGEFTNILLKNFIIGEIQIFEPIKKNINFIKKKLNNKKIFLNNFALGDMEEKKIFKEMKESSSSTFNEINKKSKYFKRKNLILNLGLNSKIYEETSIKITTGSKIIKNKNIELIDLLKIDTEGYEYYIIKGFAEEISKIKVIFFEHHYDQMIIKNYTFSDIHRYLLMQNFKMKYKFKMPFRKSFEYIYLNNNYN